jgi:hypothetical protein
VAVVRAKLIAQRSVASFLNLRQDLSSKRASKCVAENCVVAIEHAVSGSGSSSSRKERQRHQKHLPATSREQLSVNIVLITHECLEQML